MKLQASVVMAINNFVIDFIVAVKERCSIINAVEINLIIVYSVKVIM